MSQYAFSGNTIINQSFPDTRTALNAAYAALASNSSGDNDPTSVAGGSLATVQHQWWYDSTNNKLMLRNDANNAWIEIATIDETSGNVLSITTQGLTIGATALTATGTEINQLSTITRGSILYGDASGATARLAKGAADTVLTSDGTDISWTAAAGGGGYVAPTIPDWSSPDNTYTSSGTWSKGGLADNAVVWIYMVGGGSGGWSSPDNRTEGSGGFCRILVGTAADFNGGAYVIGAGGAAGANGGNPGYGGDGGNTTFTTAAGDRSWTAYGGLGNRLSYDQANNKSYAQYRFPGGEQVFESSSDSYIRISGSGSSINAKSGVSNVFENLLNTSTSSVQTSVFNGATRATMTVVNNTFARTSLFGGNAGVSEYLPSGGTTTSTTAGSVPGGMGGCARVGDPSFSGAQPKAGGAGNMRVYHV